MFSANKCHCYCIYQKVSENFLFPMAEQLLGGDEFTFQHDLTPVRNAKSTKTWFTTCGISVLSWPTNSPDRNSIKNL